ncbi:FtsW/RodA/SpoVE family cell cycle protein [Trichothermofontia sichuanensis B231]|uniref:FtsW/RodA/SpoVE family cell cycle protein n=1 Tax=Trichothermofontia sichuanensis TaxID=3045816 RepID=UPI0022479B83|nr:FtsW/RodA/SpoVE family cell cycle protein [Trichothermofontia sichuanensis]UZQ54089.1 FtsW/RodA/SpoVE family cell cycle protein [Trichothermofontia sichuanensis B231]
MDLHRFIPFFDPSVKEWALEARILRWLTFMWLGLGLIVLYSASYPIADADFGDGLYYVKRQLIWVVIGLVGFSLIVHSPLRYVQGIAHWCLFSLMGLLFLTLLPGLGTTINGATRWLVIGGVPIQPSELLKPFLVLQGARIFSQWGRLSWQTRLLWLGVFALVLMGILLQPNLSTTALCGITLWLLALAAGLPYLQLGMAALAGGCLGVLSIATREYQRRRVLSFLDPWADPRGDSYQLVQSLLAIGSGGPWGSGFGLSQQKLFYLPIQYTDFIFAVFAEEFGLIGGILLILFLAAYATLALRIAMKAQRPVHQLVAMGAMIFLIGQSLLNIGVATGALPTTGLPFPMFSYGGNSMIASLLLAGLLIRVAREGSEAEVVSLGEHRRKVAERLLAASDSRNLTGSNRRDRWTPESAFSPSPPRERGTARRRRRARSLT